MNERAVASLFAEVMKLRSKYGSQTFDELSAVLSNPIALKEIITALRKLPNTKPTRPRKKRNLKEYPRPTSIEAKVARLSLSDDETEKDIGSFANALLKRRSRITINQILPIAEAIDLANVSKLTKRSELVSSLVDRLLALPKSEVTRVLENYVDLSPRQSTLEDWARIIVKDK